MFRLSDQIDELKKLPVSDADEELFEVREKYERLHADWKIARNELEALQTDVDYKNGIIQKYEYETQKHVENITFLNQEVSIIYESKIKNKPILHINQIE